MRWIPVETYQAGLITVFFAGYHQYEVVKYRTLIILQLELAASTVKHVHGWNSKHKISLCVVTYK